MSLVPHLVSADLRRFRVGLIVWCAIVAAAALLHGVQPAFADDGRVPQLITFLTVVVWGGGSLVMLGLTAQVMQADPLIGTNAFWMTRPIAPLSLFSAKFVFIALATVLVPVAAEVVLMAVHNVTPSTIIAVAVQAVVVQLFWISIAMCFATVTRGVAQFFVLCGATPLALALVLLFVELAVSSDILLSWPTPAVFDHPRAGTAFVVLMIVAATALLMALYRTRARPRAIAVGLGLTLAALVLPELVPRPSASQTNGLPEWTRQLAPLSAETVSLRVERNPGDIAVLQGRVVTSDLPSHWSATIAVKDHTASLSLDGASITSSIGFGSPDSLRTPAVWEQGAPESTTAAALKSILGVAKIGGLPSPDTDSTPLLSTTSTDFVPFEGRAPHYSATLTLSFVERFIAGVLPLRRGASFNEGSRRMSVLAVHWLDQEDRAVHVSMRQSIGKTVFDAESSPVFEAYLRNPRRGEAVSGAVPFGDNDFSPSMLMPVPIVAEGRPFGFRIETGLYRFPPFSTNDQVPIRVDAAWMTGAELVIVGVRPAGSIDRMLEIPAVPVPARDEKR
jgi:hypothetical protein